MTFVLLSEVCNTIQCYNLEKTLKANHISHNENENSGWICGMESHADYYVQLDSQLKLK